MCAPARGSQDASPVANSAGTDMQLADFILRDMERTLGEWELFAATLLPAARNLNSLGLREHARQIIQAVAVDLSALDCIPTIDNEMMLIERHVYTRLQVHRRAGSVSCLVSRVTLPESLMSTLAASGRCYRSLDRKAVWPRPTP